MAAISLSTPYQEPATRRSRKILRWPVGFLLTICLPFLALAGVIYITSGMTIGFFRNIGKKDQLIFPYDEPRQADFDAWS